MTLGPDALNGNRSMRNRRPTAVAVAGGSLVVAGAALVAYGILGGADPFRSPDDQQNTNDEEAKAISKTYPDELLLPLPPTSSPVQRPSNAPSGSFSPSQNPSVSTVPSALPSSAPTVTAKPSSMPSESPSNTSRPTSDPSSVPSAIPSYIPSKQPTSSPSVSMEPTPGPTRYPTTTPTKSPFSSPSEQPTELLYSISSSGTFRLRLYWQQGFFWQESSEESWFCMTCARCDANVFSEHCDFEDSCQENMMLALVRCNPNKKKNKYEQRGLRKEPTMTMFTLARGGLFAAGNDFSGNQIQVHGTNLCMHKTGKSDILLQKCDASVEEQRFLGFRYGGQAMELRPEGKFMKDGVEFDRCLTQHHHPRQGERIFAEVCKKARSSDTNRWSTY